MPLRPRGPMLRISWPDTYPAAAPYIQAADRAVSRAANRAANAVTNAVNKVKDSRIWWAGTDSRIPPYDNESIGVDVIFDR